MESPLNFLEGPGNEMKIEKQLHVSCQGEEKAVQEFQKLLHNLEKGGHCLLLMIFGEHKEKVVITE